MNTGKNPATERVANDQQPLTKEQFAAFLAKRTALREKHGQGPAAREAILSEFDLTPEETTYLLSRALWAIYATQENGSFTDEELVNEMYGEPAELN